MVDASWTTVGSTYMFSETSYWALCAQDRETVEQLILHSSSISEEVWFRVQTALDGRSAYPDSVTETSFAQWWMKEKWRSRFTFFNGWSSWNVKANLYLYQVMFHINLSSIIVWALLYLPFMWHLALALPSSVHTVSGGASCQIQRHPTLNLRVNHWRFPKEKVSTRFAPEGSKHTPHFSPIMGL